MSLINDDHIMPFGKHTGKRLGDIPDDYLIWLYGELNKTRKLYVDQKKVWSYLVDNIDAIKNNLKK